MSTAQLPIDRERLSRELEQPSEEYKEQIANTVIRKLAAGPPERKPEAPDRVGCNRLPVRPHAVVRSILEGPTTDPMTS